MKISKELFNETPSLNFDPFDHLLELKPNPMKDINITNATKNNYQRVACIKDINGDWFVIPYELKTGFYNTEEALINMEEKDYSEHLNLTNEFEDKFGEYRTGGDLNLKELYIKL